jgi:hypothetical protein
MFYSNKEQNAIAMSAEDTTNIVYASARKFLDLIQESQRITLRDLMDKVIADTKVGVSIVQGLVPMYVRDLEGYKLYRGRRGGIYRGDRPQSVDKRERCDTCHQVLRTPKKSTLSM